MAPKIRCFFDIEIDDLPTGRIIFELFNDLCPKTVENFRALCTGELGLGATTQKPLHYRDVKFHRVIKGFMVQAGDFTAGNGTGGESIYGGQFDDESFDLEHDQPFLLSMANKGNNTNGSQFFITTQKTPHLDGKHVVFGRVVNGQDVVLAIEGLPVDNVYRPLQQATISNCGELMLQRSSKVKEKKHKKKTAEILSSSSDESDDQNKKKKKKKKNKDKKKKLKKHKKHESSAEEEGELRDDDPGLQKCGLYTHPLVSVSVINPEEIPEIPRNRFLYRAAREDPDAPINDDRRDNRQQQRQQPKVRAYTKSGRKVKGRGSLRYRTPSRSRSRSMTPPHWRRAQQRTLPLSRYQKVSGDGDGTFEGGPPMRRGEPFNRNGRNRVPNDNWRERSNRRNDERIRERKDDRYDMKNRLSREIVESKISGSFDHRKSRNSKDAMNYGSDLEQYQNEAIDRIFKEHSSDEENNHKMFESAGNCHNDKSAPKGKDEDFDENALDYEAMDDDDDDGKNKKLTRSLTEQEKEMFNNDVVKKLAKKNRYETEENNFIICKVIKNDVDPISKSKTDFVNSKINDEDESGLKQTKSSKSDEKDKNEFEKIKLSENKKRMISKGSDIDDKDQTNKIIDDQQVKSLDKNQSRPKDEEKQTQNLSRDKSKEKKSKERESEKKRDYPNRSRDRRQLNRSSSKDRKHGRSRDQKRSKSRSPNRSTRNRSRSRDDSSRYRSNARSNRDRSRSRDRRRRNSSRSKDRRSRSRDPVGSRGRNTKNRSRSNDRKEDKSKSVERRPLNRDRSFDNSDSDSST